MFIYTRRNSRFSSCECDLYKWGFSLYHNRCLLHFLSPSSYSLYTFILSTFNLESNMGNCLRRDTAAGKNEEQGRGRGVDGVKRMGTFTPPNEEEKRRVVRIKVVVTREELEQIMNSNKGDNYLKESSVEKLVAAMKLRGTRIYEVGTDDNNYGRSSSSWRPALESIPEDHWWKCNNFLQPLKKREKKNPC